MMKVQHGYAPGVRMPGAQPGPRTASGVTSAMASAGPATSVTTSAPASAAASGRNGSASLHATTRRAVHSSSSHRDITFGFLMMPALDSKKCAIACARSPHIEHPRHDPLRRSRLGHLRHGSRTWRCSKRAGAPSLAANCASPSPGFERARRRPGASAGSATSAESRGRSRCSRARTEPTPPRAAPNAGTLRPRCRRRR
jgi:hypothetical protein